MMRLNLILLLSWIFLFQGCFDDVEDNRRVVVTGNLVNDNGSAVTGINVETKGNTALLGFGTSDENGDFSFTSLESGATDFSIYVNPQEQDSLYASITYINTDTALSAITNDPDIRNQNLYELSSLTLKEVAFLELQINKINTAQDTLYYTITLPQTTCEITIKQGIIEPVSPDCFITYSVADQVFSEDDVYKNRFRTLKNSEAVFSYRINSGNLQQVTIPINTYNSSYVFTF